MQWTQDNDIDLNIGNNSHSRKLPKKTHLQDTRKKAIVRKFALKLQHKKKSVFL